MLNDLSYKLISRFETSDLLNSVSGFEINETLEESKHLVAIQYVYYCWQEMYDWLLEIGKHKLLFMNYKLACALSKQKPIKKQKIQ